MTSSEGHQIPIGRLIVGGTIFVVGFFSPLCVPLVARTGLPVVWKSTLSGLLLIGIPEFFAVIAAAVLGREGFDYLKGRVKRALGRFFHEHGPPERVSRARYRIGLVMFIIPIVLGWITPYAFHQLPGYERNPLLYGLAGDLLLIVSLFVLGGEFWDKLRSLFVHGAGAQFHE